MAGYQQFWWWIYSRVCKGRWIYNTVITAYKLANQSNRAATSDWHYGKSEWSNKILQKYFGMMNIVSVDLPNSFTVARNGQEDTGVFKLGYLQPYPSMGISVGASGLGFFEINGAGVFFGQTLDEGTLIFIDVSVVASGLKVTFREEITSFVGLQYIEGFIWKS